MPVRSRRVHVIWNARTRKKAYEMNKAHVPLIYVYVFFFFFSILNLCIIECIFHTDKSNENDRMTGLAQSWSINAMKEKRVVRHKISWIKINLTKLVYLRGLQFICCFVELNCGHFYFAYGSRFMLIVCTVLGVGCWVLDGTKVNKCDYEKWNKQSLVFTNWLISSTL